jgi:hypothetical protein
MFLQNLLDVSVIKDEGFCNLFLSVHYAQEKKVLGRKGLIC